MAFFTHAEIALPLASRIDFRYGARATEPARAPTSVALRSGLLSLWSAHPSQDGRAGPRRWTLQWPRKGAAAFDAPRDRMAAVVGAAATDPGRY